MYHKRRLDPLLRQPFKGMLLLESSISWYILITVLSLFFSQWVWMMRFDQKSKQDLLAAYGLYMYSTQDHLPDLTVSDHKISATKHSDQELAVTVDHKTTIVWMWSYEAK